MYVVKKLLGDVVVSWPHCWGVLVTGKYYYLTSYFSFFASYLSLVLFCFCYILLGFIFLVGLYL